MAGTLTLKNIQALRLFAALLVFVQHAYFFSSQLVGDQAMEFRKLNLGGTGVYIFFIISGFVMALQTEKTSTSFASHRIARIYPAYFLALALSTLMFFLFSSYRPSFTGIASLLLFPTGTLNSTFQVPYWTLVYEMFFYALILLLMTLTRARPSMINLALLLWLVAIFGASHYGVKVNIPSPDYTSIFLSPLNIYFITGFFLARFCLSTNHTAARLAFLLIAIELVLNGEVRYTLSVAVFGALAIVLITQLKPLPNFLNALGDYSYGIYLLHLPIIFCLYLALKPAGASFATSLVLMAVVVLPVAIGFGKFEHWLYQKKLRPAVDGFLSRKSASQILQPLEQP
jgi:peptidoglycan/LPS O-acetylase OafA/YrhL